MPNADGTVNMVDVMKYLGMKPAEFKKEWGKLTDKDKEDLKQWLTELLAMTQSESEPS